MLFLAQDAELVPPPFLASRTAVQPLTHLVLKPRKALPLSAGDGELFFRLTDGCIAVSRYLPDGRRQICDIVGPGRMFGFAVQGAGQCVAESLTYSTVERHGRRMAWASLPAEVGNMLNRQQAHALLLGRKTAAERVASALIDLLEQFGRKPAARPSFALFPTRGDLADWLGLTLETVSRCLHRFRRDRMIEFSRPERIRVLDLGALRRMSGAAD
ncbi:MAG: helix-turn-helix domain-containing protein [Rhizobium sp.]|nr:helix-turn-helix domain-containing protein [Rhizobium sp.]MBX9455307.1 helix-turn-helix domain-containing protein [Rhizobium sp.]